MINSMRRQTSRKRRIRELIDSTYAGNAILLDELRWAVLDAESTATDSKDDEISRSWLNSFARTIREQFPEFVIEKIPINNATPLGLVARTALYRLKSPSELRGFLTNAEEPTILCRFQRKQDASHKARYHWRYVIPHHHVATFRVFNEEPGKLNYDIINLYPGVLIPATQKLSLIVPPNTELDLPSIADVPWKLLGYDEDLNDRYEVAGTDSLSCVERDRRP